MKRIVTYSELKERRRCAYRAHLSYDERLAPKATKTAFREGTIADAGMNELYLGVRDFGEYRTSLMLDAMLAAKREEEARIESSGAVLLDEDWAAMEESWQLLTVLAAQYVDWAKDHDPFDEIVTMQLEGRIPVVTTKGRASSRYDFAFKPDGLVVIDGKLWLLENKWWKSISEQMLRALQMDEQCGMYLWGVHQLIERGEAPGRVLQAVERYGLPVGVYYNVVRKKLPVVPQQNKDGTTSKRKDVDTTTEVYRQALLERGQDPAEYAEILELLEAKGDTFHHREGIYRNEAELAEIGRRIYEGTRLIAHNHRLKNPTRDCTWDCQFWDLCLEWSDELVEFQYRRKAAVHEEYEDIGEAA